MEMYIHKTMGYTATKLILPLNIEEGLKNKVYQEVKCSLKIRNHWWLLIPEK